MVSAEEVGAVGSHSSPSRHTGQVGLQMHFATRVPPPCANQSLTSVHTHERASTHSFLSEAEP